MRSKFSRLTEFSLAENMKTNVLWFLDQLKKY